MRHFCSLLDLSRQELAYLIDISIKLKASAMSEKHSQLLSGRVLGLLFEKPSLRTRVSFEAAIAHCGGSSIFLSGREVGIGEREPVEDFARVVSQYVDVIAARTFSHDLVSDLARFASVPVINALSDREHPCQALADLCTMKSISGPLAGTRVVFVGDGNNVARSLAHAAALVDIDFVLCCPEGYAFDPSFLEECRRVNAKAKISQSHDPASAVKDADYVYTDVWASMGQEEEKASRARIFARFQVNAEMMSRAKSTARFMHCLPAHRGEEVTAEVIDSPKSVVIEQANYRLHAQKALILWMLGKDKDGS